MRIKRKKETFWGKDEDVGGVKFYVRKKQKSKKGARRKISFLGKKQLKRRAVPETKPPKVSFIAKPLKKRSS